MKLDLSLTSALKAWIESYVDNPNELNRQIEAEQAVRKQQAPGLLIKVSLCQQQSTSRQAEDRYFVRAWYIQNCETYRENFPAGAHEILLRDDSTYADSEKTDSDEDKPHQPQTYPQSEICQIIQHLRQICVQTWGNPDSIHLFLPRKLMTFRPDQWPHQATKTRPLFGTRHKVVLRCGDRLYQNYDLSREWDRKWQAVERLYSQQACSSLKDADPINADDFCGAVEEYSTLDDPETADIIGVKLTQPLDDLDQDELFEIFITESALPLALWLRQKLDDSTCADALDQVLGDCLLREIPNRIKKTRIQGLRVRTKQPCHIGNHLSLLWDDPYLVPPDAHPPQSA